MKPLNASGESGLKSSPGRTMTMQGYPDGLKQGWIREFANF